MIWTVRALSQRYLAGSLQWTATIGGNALRWLTARLHMVMEKTHRPLALHWNRRGCAGETDEFVTPTVIGGYEGIAKERWRVLSEFQG